jgi:hypothetical protein
MLVASLRDVVRDAYRNRASHSSHSSGEWRGGRIFLRKSVKG